MMTLTSPVAASRAADPVPFQGFAPELLRFLDDLAANNTREWFHAHRDQYEAYYLTPARQLVIALGALLPSLGAGILAEPRVFGSILNIANDTRFRKDIPLYKTTLDLWFPQGDRPSRERPGYFCRLTRQSLILGAGMHTFPRDALVRYRDAVLDPVRGERLEQLAASVGPELIGGRTRELPPRGLPADHPRAEWLLHAGLFAQIEQPLPPELYTSALPELCLARFERLRPIQQWLLELLAD